MMKTAKLTGTRTAAAWSPVERCATLGSVPNESIEQLPDHPNPWARKLIRRTPPCRKPPLGSSKHPSSAWLRRWKHARRRETPWEWQRCQLTGDRGRHVHMVTGVVCNHSSYSHTQHKSMIRYSHMLKNTSYSDRWQVTSVLYRRAAWWEDVRRVRDARVGTHASMYRESCCTQMVRTKNNSRKYHANTWCKNYSDNNEYNNDNNCSASLHGGKSLSCSYDYSNEARSVLISSAMLTITKFKYVVWMLLSKERGRRGLG